MSLIAKKERIKGFFSLLSALIYLSFFHMKRVIIICPLENLKALRTAVFLHIEVVHA